MRAIHQKLAVSLMIAALGVGALSGGVAAAEKAKESDKKKIHRTLLLLDRAVPKADSAGDAPQPPTDLQVNPNPQTMYDFLTAVVQNVDAYWSKTFLDAGLAEPQVDYNWTAPGVVVVTTCKGPDGAFQATDDTSEFYCPPDDTIYMSQAKEVVNWNARGDFAVAYLVAHEFGHSIQAELGIIKTEGPNPYKVFQTELQADCFAGVWANSAYYQGVLDPGDIEEAVGQADVYGDYLFTNPQHHGTPAERIAAFKKGYNSGVPSACAISG